MNLDLHLPRRTSSTSTAADPVNPTNSAGRRRRSVRAVLVTFLALVFALVVVAAPADAAINRGTPWTLTGTNCTLTVGGWPNTSHYPGTASRVVCSSTHTIQVRNQIWDAGTNGKAYLLGQSGWYTYYSSATPEIDTYVASCPGYLDWQYSAQVYIDGVYYGNLGNAWGWWTACT